MYGPVRTVVWQGSAGDRRPYADHARLLRLRSTFYLQKISFSAPCMILAMLVPLMTPALLEPMEALGLLKLA